MSIIDKLTKKFDTSNVVRFDSIKPFEKIDTFVHTGSSELEFNLGTLGFPPCFIEISGESKGGKTTIGLCAMKHFQQANPDGVSIILSSEERDNELYAKQIGVDTSKVIIIKSKFVEDLFFQFQELIDSTKEFWKEEGLKGKPKIFVIWDSVGATNSRAQIDTFKKNMVINRKNLENNTKIELKHAVMGDFAKSATNCMKAVLGQIYENDIVFIALNHLKDRFDSPGKYTPGGKFLEYLPAIRLQMSRVEWIKISEGDNEIEVGQISKIKIEKNDFGSRRTTMVELLLGYGIVLSAADIQYGVDKGILKKDGVRKISFANGKMTWSTKREFYELYKTKHKLLPVLHGLIKKSRHKEILITKNVEIEED